MKYWDSPGWEWQDKTRSHGCLSWVWRRWPQGLYCIMECNDFEFQFHHFLSCAALGKQIFWNITFYINKIGTAMSSLWGNGIEGIQCLGLVSAPCGYPCWLFSFLKNFRALISYWSYCLIINIYFPEMKIIEKYNLPIYDYKISAEAYT